MKNFKRKVLQDILNKFVPIRAERKNPRIDSSENAGI
jgi:hypothetical protein